MTEWQPIETAPKDGTQILVWASGEPVIVAYYLGREPTTHSYAYPWQAIGRSEAIRHDVPQKWALITPPS